MWSFFSRDPSKDFPYEIAEHVTGTENYMIWKLHKGKKKVDVCATEHRVNMMIYMSKHWQGTGEAISVFILDAKAGASDTQLELAKSAVKRLKTLRHPNVLTYVDSLEVLIDRIRWIL